MTARLDHLVIAGTDLSAVVAWWHHTTGVAPTAGGAHTGRGTRNALVGLGPSTYLELIGPDEAQPDHVGPRPFGINELEPNSIQLVTFALAVDDLEASTDVVRRAGLDPGPITPMRRLRPDGVELSWRLAVPPDPKLGGVMPFLIEWGPDTPHPAASLLDAGGATGCEVRGIELTHPSPEALNEALESLGAGLTVSAGARPAVAAELTTPNGSLRL
jgi:hypothetical protein